MAGKTQRSVPSGVKFRGRMPFSIGICATDQSLNLPRLIGEIKRANIPDNFQLTKIVVVASGIEAGTLFTIRKLAAEDPTMLLIVETTRSGKASAQNEILRHVGQDDFLLLINSDALPEPESIPQLLNFISMAQDLGVVSACPEVASEYKDTTFKLEELMWKIHNESSLLLNHMHLSNHCSDEMMVVRLAALGGKLLPAGLVNDGAYIGGVAKINGYRVGFCEKAKVSIDVPHRFTDLIDQRRRIIFGHIQIWRLTGSSPKTIESMLLTAPLLSLTIAIKMLSKNLRLLMALPVAVACELISSVLALNDNTRRGSKDRHSVWRRYGN